MQKNQVLVAFFQRRVEGFDPAQGVAQFRVSQNFCCNSDENPKLSNSLGGVEAFDPALGVAQFRVAERRI